MTAGDNRTADDTTGAPATPGGMAVKDAYEIFAAQINKEDDRIHQRMTWGLTANGAILTIFGTLYGYVIAANTLTTNQRLAIAAFLTTLPALAIGISLTTIRAIGDARKQIYYIRRVYMARWNRIIEDHAGLPRPFGSRNLYVLGPGDSYPELTLFLPPWLPLRGRLAGRRLLSWRLSGEAPQPPIRLSRWWADDLMRAVMLIWGLVVVLVLLVFTQPTPTPTPLTAAAPAPTAAARR